MRNILFVFIFLVACKVHHHTSNDDRNNVVHKQISSTANLGGGSTEIVFEGMNNIIDIIHRNCVYFDKTHDVIIVKGDDNIFKLYNINIIDLRGVDTSTLIIVGNKVKYAMIAENQVVFKKKGVSVDSIHVKTEPINFNHNNEKLDSNSEGYSKIVYYEKLITQDDSTAYFELAEIYNYGLYGISSNTGKATTLYEYGVINNSIASIRRLGDIWYNGTFDQKANQIKGLYYYKLGAQLNDSYCVERLGMLIK